MDTPYDLSAIAILLAFFIIFLLGGNIFFLINRYQKEKAYILREIYRTTGKEQKYWQRELRALRLSLIPGISFQRARGIVHKKKTP